MNQQTSCQGCFTFTTVNSYGLCHKCADLICRIGASEIRDLQKQILLWEQQYFTQDPLDKLLGITEEVGELAHTQLKQRQGIRINEDYDALAKDAVGDIFIYLSAFCSAKGWDLSDIIHQTWASVEARDWTQNKIDGMVLAEDKLDWEPPPVPDPENDPNDLFYKENKDHGPKP